MGENQNKGQGGVPPQSVVMQMVLGGWVSKTISDVTRLDVPDVLKKHGPLTAQELVEQHGVQAHAGALHRALRACASLGLFTEDAQGRFGITALCEPLTLDSPVSVKKITEMMGASWYEIWGGFTDALRTGTPQVKARLGMEYWDYCKANPKEMEDFGEAMKANSHASLRGVCEHLNMDGVGTLADVGGGFGHLAIALLEKHPGLRAIVAELPELVPIAEKHLPDSDDIKSRVSFFACDMFETVPEAEVYIMKHIIHDWDDARCIRLLQNCVAKMRGDGRVVCVDAVLPPLGDTSGTPAKFLDLNMLVNIPGKERTMEEWESLYAAAGLKIKSATPIHDNFGTSIIEGVRA